MLPEHRSTWPHHEVNEARRRPLDRESANGDQHFLLHDLEDVNSLVLIGNSTPRLSKIPLV